MVSFTVTRTVHASDVLLNTMLLALSLAKFITWSICSQATKPPT